MAKASGTSIKDHPVIDQLVKIRVMLEKIQPLDQKLQYQIEKLLKTAQTGKLSINDKNDPLSFKPDLGSMGDNQEGDEDDEDTRLMNKAGLYQAPRISGNRLVRGGDYEEGEDVRKQKRERKNKEKAVRSSMAQLIEEEYGDAPEELADEMDEMEKEDDAEREQREYEEENLVRLSQSKKDLKKKKPKKLSDGLDDIGDFGDLASITANVGDNDDAKEGKEYLKRKRMEQMMAQLGKTKRSKGDEEVELIDKVKKPKRILPPKAEDDDIPLEDDEPEYDGIPRSEAQYYTEDTDVAGGKRHIDYKMEKNRGLTRIRNPEKSHSRIKYKYQYNAAIKKVNASRSKAQHQGTNYKGTRSVNPNAIRSTPYLH
ncbi:U3 snoRNP protein [Cavenderia fasciculata]|uniref:U3 snoRNP protein n=1 Tax=Cavenderia fasciculata TaxID=261658 RepID=F4Q7V2_CACFS|nr:U3 snoRNP protein [Cavenderia fasciculata]EGG15852.1 U3 snoRNP protein [Cavenderia fasciculata]|eukprot:XP_004352177.1 U3 snoRNP protein [Cavenderia fasciculata]